jgi:hypothetical protein
MNILIKLNRLAFALTIPLLILSSCGQNKNKEPEVKSSPELKTSPKDLSIGEISAKIDTALFHVDTILNPIKINADKFALIVTKDKYDENKKSTYDEDEEAYISPISVHVFDYNKNMIVTSKKFEENSFAEFNPYILPGEQAKNYFLSLISSAGGSGFSGTIYQIVAADSVQFKNILDFGALSYLIFSKQGDRIIKLEGDWNSDEGESHFANHRYSIYDYSITGSVQSKLLGKTKQKYSSGDEEKSIKEILESIKSKEPELLKTVELSDFVFH